MPKETIAENSNVILPEDEEMIDDIIMFALARIASLYMMVLSYGDNTFVFILASTTFAISLGCLLHILFRIVSSRRSIA